MGRRKDDKTLHRAVERLEEAKLIDRNCDGRWQRSEALFDKEEDR